MGVGEELLNCGSNKTRCNVRSISVGVKRQLFEIMVSPTVTFGADKCGMETDEGQKLDV